MDDQLEVGVTDEAGKETEVSCDIMTSTTDVSKSNNINITSGSSSHNLETKIQTLSENKDRKPTTNYDVEQEVKLCGWLYIITRGLIKTSKQQRYCVFGDNTCKLYIYRGQHDLVPIDDIDISRASFHFENRNSGKPGSFQISSYGREYLLEANDRHTMMYWLQELQKRRRQFIIRRSSLTRDRMSQKSVRKPAHLTGLTSNALAGNQSDSKWYLEQPTDCSNPIIHVSANVPTYLSLPSPDGTHTQPAWSFTNIKSEIQNVFTNIREQVSIENVVPRKWSHRSDSPSPSTDTSPSPNQEHFTFADPREGSKVAPSASNKGMSKGTSKFKSAFGSFKNMKLLKKNSTDIVEESGNISCARCRELEEKILIFQHEHAATEEELSANRDMVLLFKKELDIMRKQTETRIQSRTKDETVVDEMLQQRDKHIVELEHCLSVLREEKSINNQKIKSQESQLKTLKEQMSMFQDMLQAKDQAIVKLTTNLSEAEKLSDHDLSSISSSSLDSPDGVPPSKRSNVIYQRDDREILKYKELCEGYEMQNQFLTEEVAAVNELRQHAEDDNKRLVIDYAKLEATYYRTNSKYLFLLNEIKQPKRGGGSGNDEEVVNQLLDDALSTEIEEARNLDIQFTSSGHEYDKYGFVKHFIEEDQEEELDPLVVTATMCERQSEELDNKIEQAQDLSLTSHRVKWENFLVNLSGKPLQRSTEVKNLIRLGVPHEYRSQIWKGCVNFYIGADRDKLGPTYYKGLISRSLTMPHDPSTKQIELDLLRTLPNNKHFESIESEGICKLRRCLVALSIHNHVIGYCQGLNRLAAIGLLYLTEEETFWLMVAIIDHLMPPNYYSKTLIAAQADQRVLKDLIQEKIPRLASHVDAHTVDLSLFTFNWFLTIFVDNIPPETFLRIWDAFLYEGSKVLFRFAVAFFKQSEEAIMKCNSPIEINHFLRVIGEKMTNTKSLVHLAYHWINPFGMRGISTKRQFYLQQLEVELAELDRLRAEIKTRDVDTEWVYCSDED